MKYDVCIIGSGAGAGPVAYELSKAGHKVIVLEKGPWIRTEDFTKDEIVSSRRDVYIPRLKDEPQVTETQNSEGQWEARSNHETGQNMWNGNCVGGSSNLMSAYFHRMKPNDFRLLSAYGPIEGANIVDWPITYAELEPYFTKVEKVVGVSGRVIQHKHQEPRSTEQFPYPPLVENIVSKWIDKACDELNTQAVPVARGILSVPEKDRNACSYSNYCGSYGCATDAKGSSRVALLNKALSSGCCTILPFAKVFYLETDGRHRISRCWYHNQDKQAVAVEARIYVVAAQAIETSRLLLLSNNREFPKGLANTNGQVGKNLIFSGGGIGSGQFYYDELDPQDVLLLKAPGLFVNRSLHHWYEIEDNRLGGKLKGGIVDFLFEHANGIRKAIKQKWGEDGQLLYGSELKLRLQDYFTGQRKLNFEVFNDWLPTDNCFVSLDPSVKDKWGDAVARIRLGYHPHDVKIGSYLAQQAEKVLEQMGAKNIQSRVSGSAPPNLVAGGCRFGNNPANSVLDKDCRAHEVENLFVSDASFMPTGGSVPYTWTIYANAFRVADSMMNQLG